VAAAPRADAVGGVCPVLIYVISGAVFVHVGVQSTRGTAKDTLGLSLSASCGRTKSATSPPGWKRTWMPCPKRLASHCPIRNASCTSRCRASLAAGTTRSLYRFRAVTFLCVFAVVCWRASDG
jgi:hypothetical protein